ncbi:MAG: histidinol phosphate phosphatase [Rothia mucilaginosa]|uniref:inositol monophosphatase family protein n=1 Tax=Rothia mucilaginosa TaxID=43675 RepID=UPI001D78C6E2|nr:inositol monophosphatase family protein [Rothia mucilaginosa]MBS6433850.1 histidinol phosphate phosphatase [Rothia mucilaginosa]
MSRTPLYTDDLRLAHILADSVDRVSSSRFRDRPAYSPTDGGTAIGDKEQKPAEPVPLAPWQRAAQQKAEPEPVVPEAPADYALEAALEVEELLRAQLSRVRTRDGIAGEHAGHNGQAARQWVIAPLAELDNFRRGVPVWATLIALLDQGEPVVGVVSAPALGRRWWAARGSGAYTGKSLAQATRLQVSEVTQLDWLSVAYTDIASWERAGFSVQDLTPRLLHLLRSANRSRAYGSFWSACLLAEGAVDTAVDPSLSFFEVAALLPIIREAGGVASTLEGNLPEHASASEAVSLVASNTAAVQELVLQILSTEG